MLTRIGEVCRPSDESARVVDVGCGTGALVPFLKDGGVAEDRVIGVDLSTEVRGRARGGVHEAFLIRARVSGSCRRLDILWIAVSIAVKDIDFSRSGSWKPCEPL